MRQTTAVPLISDELKSFIESDPVIAVGTRSAELVPNSLRGWGPAVSGDGNALVIFVDRPAAATCVANLHDNGRVAVCFTNVRTLRSAQLKGRCVEIGDPQAGDWTWIDKHRQAFTDAVGKVGFPPSTIRNMWSTQVVKIRFVVDDIFDQTPGPGAGRAL